jgi:predicted GIY-YIG superfamily endonuclease
MSVYKITCPDNHFYIGSTKNNIEVRLYNHKIASRRHNTKFYSHIDNWDEVKMELLEETTDYRNKEYEYIYNERNNLSRFIIYNILYSKNRKIKYVL